MVYLNIASIKIDCITVISFSLSEVINEKKYEPISYKIHYKSNGYNLFKLSIKVFLFTSCYNFLWNCN